MIVGGFAVARTRRTTSKPSEYGRKDHERGLICAAHAQRCCGVLRRDDLQASFSASFFRMRRMAGRKGPPPLRNLLQSRRG
jgi:hypothetical protein